MAAANRVSTAWIRPIETDPSLLINREAELEALVTRLEDLRDAGVTNSRILVHGERGSGKSILAKAALAKWKEEQPTEVATVELQGRSLQYRSLLEALARQVAEEARDCVRDDDPLRILLDELMVLGSTTEISRGATDTQMRRYGVDAAAGASLFAKLSARFAWEERRSMGQTTSATAAITDAILHAAICDALHRLAGAAITVAILFDDLDQVVVHGRTEEAQELWKKILSIEPCIALVHLRSEMLAADVRREIVEQVEVPPLPAKELVRVLPHRLDLTPSRREPRGAREALAAWAGPFHKLATLGLSPLVYLHWTKALLDAHGPTPPDDWDDEARLFAARPQNQDLDPGLLKRLLELVDRCAVIDQRYCKPADLKRGYPVTATGPAGSGLSDEELDYWVRRAELLVPRNRFDPEPVYCVDPVLDVLRPSIRRRLR